MLIPGVDGSLYTWTSDNGVERLPASIQEIVDRTPFTARGIRYVGDKSTDLFLLDKSTGRVQKAFSSSRGSSEDAVGGKCPDDLVDDFVWVGRTTFRLYALDEQDGSEKWNTSFGFYSSLSDGPAPEPADADHPYGFAFDEEVPMPKDLPHKWMPQVAATVDGNIFCFLPSFPRESWSHQLPAPVTSAHVVFGPRGDSSNAARSSGEEWSSAFLMRDRLVTVKLAFVHDGGDGGNTLAADSLGRGLFIGKTPHGDFYALSNPTPSHGGAVSVPVHTEEDATEVARVTSECSSDSPDFPHCLVGFHRVSLDLTEYRYPSLLPRLPPAPQNAVHPDTTAPPAGVSMRTLVLTLVGGIGVAILLSVLAWRVLGDPSPTPFGGRIVVDKESVLGRGSRGTVVYLGHFEGRPVAVKRMLKDYCELAEKEISLLISSDCHPHVLRYFAKEQDDTFVYLALERCVGSLADLIEEPAEFRARLKCILHERVENETTQQEKPVLDVSQLLGQLHASRLTLLRQMMEGIAHLHSLDIVHRDLKPHNILLKFDPLPPATRRHGTEDTHSPFQSMIADMGLGKRLHQASSFSTGLSGSTGWVAPEVLQATQLQPGEEKPRLTKAVDIFAAGIVIFFTLTGGHHPFGDTVERQVNILDSQMDLSRLREREEAKQEEEKKEEKKEEEGTFPLGVFEVEDLVGSMVEHEPALRPSAADVVEHPMFWDAAKKLDFLQDVSDFLQLTEEDSTVRSRLERASLSIVGPSWLNALTPVFAADLRSGQFRKYDGSSLRDLLRVIRNKRNHFRELSAPIRAELGAPPEAYYHYFVKRFPRLLMHTYRVLACFAHPVSDTVRPVKKGRRKVSSKRAAARMEKRAHQLESRVERAGLLFERYYSRLSPQCRSRLMEAAVECRGWYQRDPFAD